jgi:phage baseplate assembly protein W
MQNDVDKYLKIPIRFTPFFKTRTLEQTSLQDSLANNLHLIIITAHGELSYDEEYGCPVWERDFEHIQRSKLWLKELDDGLKKIMSEYEPRLQNFQIQCEIQTFEHKFETVKGSGIRMRKKLIVTIRAKLVSTGEDFRMTDTILLSPYSQE